MNVNHFSWMWRVMFVAGLLCGSAELAGRGEEPNPLAPLTWPPTPAATPAAADGVAGPGGHVERLLEGLSSPRLMMWDDRVLLELRRRLAADEDQARRRQQQLHPGPHPWRPDYGPVAPLFFVPQHLPGGGLDVYRGEIQRLDALFAHGRPTAVDFYMHGLIHYESGYLPIALRDFEQAVRLARTPSDRYYSLRGLVHFGLGEYREAWDDLNEAVRLSPDVRNLNNRGVIASLFGQTDRALQDFDAALGVRQYVVKTSSISINRALALSDAGRNEEAAAGIKSVVGMAGDPDAVDPGNYAAGFVYRRMGDFVRSGISYDIVIQKKRAENVAANGQPTTSAIAEMPDNHSFLDEFAGEETVVDALVGRGVAHHELNQLGPAVADYSQVIRLAPKRTAAYVNRAVAYIDRGSFNLAENDLQTALKLNPNDAFALGNLGLLKLRQGQTASGQADLARCVELRKDLQPILQRISNRVQQPQASPSSTPQTPAARPSPWDNPEKPVGPPSSSSTPQTPAASPSPWDVPEKPAGPPSASGTSGRWAWLSPEIAKPPAMQPVPSDVPAAPPAQPTPVATVTAPVHRPYTAATPAEAVAWLADAGKREDLDAIDEALAFPLGKAFHDLHAAAVQMDVAMSKYKAARNAQSGGFLNLAHSPLEEQIERDKRKFADAHKFVVQEMKILHEESAGGEAGGTLRLVIETRKMNARGEPQTVQEIYYAVREGKVCKLLPEQSWLAVNDAREREAMLSYFDKQITRLRAMCAITEKATQSLLDGQPVSEIAIFMAWAQVSEGVPLPGRMGDEPPSMGEILASEVWKHWSQGQPPQEQDVPQQPPVPKRGGKPNKKPDGGQFPLPGMNGGQLPLPTEAK